MSSLRLHFSERGFDLIKVFSLSRIWMCPFFFSRLNGSESFGRMPNLRQPVRGPGVRRTLRRILCSHPPENTGLAGIEPGTLGARESAHGPRSRHERSRHWAMDGTKWNWETLRHLCKKRALISADDSRLDPETVQFHQVFVPGALSGHRNLSHERSESGDEARTRTLSDFLLHFSQVRAFELNWCIVVYIGLSRD